MGLFDTFSDLFSGDFGGFTGDVLGGFLGSGSQPAPTYAMMPGYGGMPDPSPPQSYPVAQTPNLPARARAAGLPMWSARFPSLWQYLQTHMLGSGAVGALMSALTKFGPTAMATIVGGAVVADLINYKVSRKRRRMNPANTKALRRSLRRLKSFDRLAHRVSVQLHRGGRRGRSTSRGRTIVTGSRSVVAD